MVSARFLALLVYTCIVVVKSSKKSPINMLAKCNIHIWLQYFKDANYIGQTGLTLNKQAVLLQSERSTHL